MSAIGGSVAKVTLKGRMFAIAADADVTLKLGGFENEVQANGNGTVRGIKKRVPSMAESVTLSVDSDSDDLTFLQDLANLDALFPVEYVMANGSIYSGEQQITGELKYSSQNATATVTLSGGTLAKQ
jgi:hypothetical protein